MESSPARLQPAFYGGAFIGVLSSLPFVSLGNCCCCLWVIGGGVLTAYLMQQNHPYAIKTEDGLLGGLIAGAIGALIATVLAIPLQLVMGDFQRQILERIASNPDMPEQYRSLLERVGTRTGGVIAVLLGGIVNLVIYSVVSMIGGLLGVALFRKKDLPPAPGTTEILPPA